MILQTERLVLRGWNDADLAHFAELNADPLVMEFFPALLSRVESDAMAMRMQRHLDQYGWGLWAVEVRETGLFAGFIGLAEPKFQADFTPCVEIGWRLGTPFWRKGYATEGAAAVLAFGFGELGLGEIVSFTTESNWRSRRVMERIGMTRDPTGDFDHPSLPGESHLRRHVLYRKAANRI
ncbi:GNAT family N-acetyltransferase [Blastopirellula sp. JC732]|uniref:GNAT family N-acetyltransferase n=1 Tax=Blastopirellula sediminis TaxID=2894196 RepID=A0A9X1MLF9_9BACT|nr:GNAT family N-acetyltransferase [Blastopirellula sediminis]MCC9609545.1 GNAT family N-acetyltransferase [Blastopirellula sediminis]MCC9627679.1 GNAT family N-acetyltransferase [Blastopirellula sediminis]